MSIGSLTVQVVYLKAAAERPIESIHNQHLPAAASGLFPRIMDAADSDIDYSVAHLFLMTVPWKCFGHKRVLAWIYLRKS
jgi:hypothetical protein